MTKRIGPKINSYITHTVPMHYVTKIISNYSRSSISYKLLVTTSTIHSCILAVKDLRIDQHPKFNEKVK